jgi:hypothetical protein
MNERITELMLEAGRTIPGDKHIDADFCNKFAELIIRECADVVHKRVGPKSALDVLDHFGVTE